MATLKEMIAADNAKRASKKKPGLLDALKNSAKVINEGLLNPNQFNAPAANKFKDSALGLLSAAPGAGDYASAAQAADYWNRGEKGNAVLAGIGALPLIPSLAGAGATLASLGVMNKVAQKIGTPLPKGPARNQAGAIVYHGSPHKFDKFDMSKIGTGEGKQQQGVGLYFAESKDVGQRYADRLADMHGKAEGNLYKVDLPDDAVSKFANYETSFMQQPESVRNAVAPLITDDVMHNLKGYYGWESIDDAPMAAIMGALDISNGNSRAAVTDAFKKSGIPGIRYLDGNSRGTGGTSNYVLFDDQLPRILEVNGVPTGLEPWAKDVPNKVMQVSPPYKSDPRYPRMDLPEVTYMGRGDTFAGYPTREAYQAKLAEEAAYIERLKAAYRNTPDLTAQYGIRMDQNTPEYVNSPLRQYGLKQDSSSYGEYSTTKNKANK